RASSSANVSTVPDGWMMMAGLSGLATACSRICMCRLYDFKLDRCQDPWSLPGFPSTTLRLHAEGDRGCVMADGGQPRPPSGVLTFLFTDIGGSTRRWESYALAMRAALAIHDELLGRLVEEHGGLLFNHTGDGVCAAFASPRAAVDAAVAAQRALELPVRMGIATGEAELRDGDYFGTVLNRAARVMAAGHGGQILLADSAAVLLSGVDLVDLGPRRLRDLPAPVGVFQVQAPGLGTDFPALRALDARPGNLRPAVTSFIGRESEGAALQPPVKPHPLVTLTR